MQEYGTPSGDPFMHGKNMQEYGKENENGKKGRRRDGG